jgi:alkylhydroperoxidase family enzyme
MERLSIFGSSVRLAHATNNRKGVSAMTTFLAPVAKPKGLMLRLGYAFTRRQFGQVPGPLSVFCARMPTAFARFYMKAGALEKKLKLASETTVLIRERVASTNMCLFCMDSNRWSAINKKGVDAAKLDALGDYRTSPLFSDSERAALAFATELTEERHVSPGTFAELARHYSEREICEIVFLVSSEHLYNINNLGLNIGSAGMCEAGAVGRAAVDPATSRSS